MSARYVIFLEVLGLIGALAFFFGQHRAHLDAIQDSLDTIKKHMEASEKALEKLSGIKAEVANARVETDKKLLDADEFVGPMRYDYYDRLLREDAERRAGNSQTPGGTDGSVR